MDALVRRLHFTRGFTDLSHDVGLELLQAELLLPLLELVLRDGRFRTGFAERVAKDDAEGPARVRTQERIAERAPEAPNVLVQNRRREARPVAELRAGGAGRGVGRREVERRMREVLVHLQIEIRD